jgi:hypothetical protein
MKLDRNAQCLVLSPRMPVKRKLKLLAEIAPTERFLVRVLRANPHPKVAAVAAASLKELREARTRKKLQDAVLRDLKAIHIQPIPEPVIQKMDSQAPPVAPVRVVDKIETQSDEAPSESVRNMDSKSQPPVVQKTDRGFSALAKAILAGDQPSEASFKTARNLASEVTEARSRYFYAEEFSRELRFAGLRLTAERSLADFLASNPGLIEYSQSYMNSIYERTRCDVLTSSWDDLNYNQRCVKRDLRLLAEKSPDAEIRRKSLARIAPPTVDREPQFNPKFLPESRVVCEQNFLFMSATHPELPPETRNQAIGKIEQASKWYFTGGPYSNFLLQWISFLSKNPGSKIPNLGVYERRKPLQGALAASPYTNGLGE